MMIIVYEHDTCQHGSEVSALRTSMGQANAGAAESLSQLQGSPVGYGGRPADSRQTQKEGGKGDPMTRRVILGALLPVFALAQEADTAITAAWCHSPQGIQVDLAANNLEVKAYEVRLLWRHDFLGQGPYHEELQTVTGNQVFFELEARPTWVQVDAWGLVRGPVCRA